MTDHVEEGARHPRLRQPKACRRNVLKAGLSLAGLAAAGLPREATALERGGTLHIGVNAEMNYNMLCFSMTGDSLDYVYAWPVYESLFRPNAAGTVDPWLLDSFSAEPENLRYVFKIRRDVVFSDGSLLTTAVVKWNLDHYMRVGAKRTALLGAVHSIDVIDDDRLEMKLNSWSSIIPAALSRECGYMFSQRQFEAFGERHCQQYPVGTGPFVLQIWTRDVDKVFVRNDRYWAGPVKLDGLVYTIYGDSLVGQAALLAGEIDVFAGMELTGIKPLANAGFVCAAEPVNDHATLLAFNSLDASGTDPMGKLAVRQAICHAIDRRALVEAAYLGHAAPSTQFGVGGHYLSRSVIGYDYDPVKARLLLGQAGYPDGFSTQIRANGGRVNRAVLAILQADLAAIGIDASTQVLAGAAATQAATGWGSGMWYQSSSIYVNVAMQMASIFPAGLTGGVLGLTTMLRPADVTAALAHAVTATSEPEAVAAVGEANRLLIDKYAIYMPIAEYCYLYVLSKRVKDSGIGAHFYAVATLAQAYLET